jgi:hypothetical protein
MPPLLLHNAPCTRQQSKRDKTGRLISRLAEKFVSHSLKLHLERSGVTLELVLDKAAVSSS